jgi:cholesterol oxidase
MNHYDCDYVVIGSGFGGSVAALRLAEKGYRVLVLEKGRSFNSNDFPGTNWNLKRWMWLPLLIFYGFFKLTFLRNMVSIFISCGLSRRTVIGMLI